MAADRKAKLFFTVMMANCRRPDSLKVGKQWRSHLCRKPSCTVRCFNGCFPYLWIFEKGSLQLLGTNTSLIVCFSSGWWSDITHSDYLWSMLGFQSVHDIKHMFNVDLLMWLQSLHMYSQYLVYLFSFRPYFLVLVDKEVTWHIMTPDRWSNTHTHTHTGRWWQISRRNFLLLLRNAEGFAATSSTPAKQNNPPMFVGCFDVETYRMILQTLCIVASCTTNKIVACWTSICFHVRYLLL